MNTQLKTPRWCVYWCKMCEIWDQCIKSSVKCLNLWKNLIKSSVQCLNLWKNLVKSSVQCLKILEWIYQTQYGMCKTNLEKFSKQITNALKFGMNSLKQCKMCKKKKFKTV